MFGFLFIDTKERELWSILALCKELLEQNKPKSLWQGQMPGPKFRLDDQQHCSTHPPLANAEMGH
jgi:hypothetical protein